MINPIAVYHLENGNVKEAAKLIQENDIVTNPTVIVKPLAEAYVKNKDFASVAAFLKHLQKQSVQQGNTYDAAGQFLVHALQGLREDGEGPVIELLNSMVRSGMRVSNGVMSHIESGYRGRMPSAVSGLLDKMTSHDGSLRFDEEEFGKHPRNMNIDELESHLLVRRPDLTSFFPEPCFAHLLNSMNIPSAL